MVRAEERGVKRAAFAVALVMGVATFLGGCSTDGMGSPAEMQKKVDTAQSLLAVASVALQVVTLLQSPKASAAWLDALSATAATAAPR